MWNYARRTLMTGTLDNWHYAAGLPVPDILWREERFREAEGRIDAGVITDQAWPMCNRYQPGERHRIEKLFGAMPLRAFNAGPDMVHPRDPGWVIRKTDAGLVLDQMSWGFPVTLRGKSGQLLKPKAVNNARFDKLVLAPVGGAASPALSDPDSAFCRSRRRARQDDRDLAFGEGSGDFCLGGTLAE